MWGAQVWMEPRSPKLTQPACSLAPFFTGWAGPPEVTVEPGLSSCTAQACRPAARVDSRASVQSQAFSLH